MSVPLANSIEAREKDCAKLNPHLSNNNDDDQNRHRQSPTSGATSQPITVTGTGTVTVTGTPTPLLLHKDMEGGREMQETNESYEEKHSFSFSWESNVKVGAEEEEESEKRGLELNVGGSHSTGPHRNYNNHHHHNNNLLTGPGHERKTETDDRSQSQTHNRQNNNPESVHTKPSRETFGHNSNAVSGSGSGSGELLLLLHEEVDGSEAWSSSLPKTSSLLSPGAHSPKPLEALSEEVQVKAPSTAKVCPREGEKTSSPSARTVGRERRLNQFEIIPWKFSESGDAEIKKETVTLQFFSPIPQPIATPKKPKSWKTRISKNKGRSPNPNPNPNSNRNRNPNPNPNSSWEFEGDSTSLASTVVVTRSVNSDRGPRAGRGQGQGQERDWELYEDQFQFQDRDSDQDAAGAGEVEGRGGARRLKKVDFQIPGEMGGKVMGTDGECWSLGDEQHAEHSSVTLNEELENESQSQEQEVENRSDNSNKKHVTTSLAVTPTTTTGTTDGHAKKGAQSQLTSTSVRRRSRSPTGNIMREIRKMSLASQDAKEEKKKAQAAAAGGGGGGVDGGGVGGSGSSTVGPGGGNSKKAAAAAKRLNRRRKRREEEYTDKDRAAAVTLGSRDIKQSLKAKKKRERKLHISIDLLHSEDFLSAMFVVEAAYQMRVKKQTSAALITLNKALELQPTHKAALVARSQCHLKLGDAASALKDAETSFEGNETYIMGLYQYAEALYNLGQFEKALIAYHRGYRIRKVESFRIGIQKSQEAIRRAIGVKQEHGSICPAPDDSNGVANTTGTGKATNIGAVGGGGGGGGSGGNGNGNGNISGNTSGNTGGNTSGNSGSKRIGTGSKHKAPSKSRARWVAREVLGQMYFDKDYLTKFLHRPDIQSDQGASQELRSNATEALNYLEIREQFWRQQNPIYARKQGLNLNNKMALQASSEQPSNPQQRQETRLGNDGLPTEVSGGGGGSGRPRHSISGPHNPSSTNHDPNTNTSITTKPDSINDTNPLAFNSIPSTTAIQTNQLQAKVKVKGKENEILPPNPKSTSTEAPKVKNYPSKTKTQRMGKDIHPVDGTSTSTSKPASTSISKTQLPKNIHQPSKLNHAKSPEGLPVQK